ncbi:MAG: hypothetical protein U0V70_03710 [Terriglobia bacterium]
MDLLTGAAYERDMEELGKPGLYVDLGPWQSHLFRCHQTRRGSSFSSVASTKQWQVMEFILGRSVYEILFQQEKFSA